MSTRSIRFDVSSDSFATVSAAYDAAVERADRLLRRLLRAEKAGEFSYARKIQRKLARAEIEVEVAREALTEHTKATAVGAWREKRRPARTPARVLLPSRSGAALVA